MRAEEKTNMSTKKDEAGSPVIESIHDLVKWFAAGEKPPDAWRIGTEHEKFGFHLDKGTALSYDGPQGIGELFDALIHEFGWQPIYEQGNAIALRRDGSQAVISLEPGGQLELSGAPLNSIHETRAELDSHFAELERVAQPRGIAFAGLGHSPTWSLESTPSMPKGRYSIMRNYMPKVGSKGLDMMYRTATVQVNLDYQSEIDMVRKYRASLGLQPIVSALFANSPFVEGFAPGFRSARCMTWLDTDPSRSGMPRFVFEEGMGYERYTDYALDVPMYFVYRNGRYIDVAGQSFRDFLKGRLPPLKGERPTISDWADHVSTLFPDVRLKQYLEMRGADSGNRQHLCALPALWTGLLYDAEALDQAIDLVSEFSISDLAVAKETIPGEGLRARIGKSSALDVAKRMLEISSAGLRRRRRLNSEGFDEGIYLRCAQLSAATGMSPADVMLQKYRKGWNQNAKKALYHEAI
jgi:glutamate--cysteine ligase